MFGLKTGNSKNKKGVRIDIQPRFKIQYPMKNRCNIKLFKPLKQQFLRIE
jgi:hypothetical protein